MTSTDGSELTSRQKYLSPAVAIVLITASWGIFYAGLLHPDGYTYLFLGELWIATAKVLLTFSSAWAIAAAVALCLFFDRVPRPRLVTAACTSVAICSAISAAILLTILLGGRRLQTFDHFIRDWAGLIRPLAFTGLLLSQAVIGCVAVYVVETCSNRQGAILLSIQTLGWMLIELWTKVGDGMKG